MCTRGTDTARAPTTAAPEVPSRRMRCGSSESTQSEQQDVILKQIPTPAPSLACCKPVLCSTMTLAREKSGMPERRPPPPRASAAPSRAGGHRPLQRVGAWKRNGEECETGGRGPAMAAAACIIVHQFLAVVATDSANWAGGRRTRF
eukprot:TRINITY_DN2070_c4_g1_i1.p2 TRINITY_DN2070_c4_g1~~TRINITY_DN2070_c4_g1_i1.p2  ORF type:complete len:147 (+),score=17.38 TRINITY_DN2070_c4_g1_i1:447-887(+)